MTSRERTVPRIVTMLVLISLSVGGCSSAQQAQPSALEGSWVLESFGAVSGLEAAEPQVVTDVTLTKGKATGNGGVNTFTSTYQAPEAGMVSFGPIAATRMAGPANAMKQENAFFAALEKTTGFEITGDNLVLSDLGNNTLMILAPTSAPTASIGLPAPIIVEPGQPTADAKVGDTIVFNQPDPANTTITTDNPDVLVLVQGLDDGSAKFNPAATAKTPGVAVVTIRASDGSTSQVTVTVS